MVKKINDYTLWTIIVFCFFVLMLSIFGCIPLQIPCDQICNREIPEGMECAPGAVVKCQDENSVCFENCEVLTPSNEVAQ